jgi:hypothetical protein
MSPAITTQSSSILWVLRAKAKSATAPREFTAEVVPSFIMFETGKSFAVAHLS